MARRVSNDSKTTGMGAHMQLPSRKRAFEAYG